MPRRGQVFVENTWDGYTKVHAKKRGYKAKKRSYDVCACGTWMWCDLQAKHCFKCGVLRVGRNADDVPGPESPGGTSSPIGVGTNTTSGAVGASVGTGVAPSADIIALCENDIEELVDGSDPDKLRKLLLQFVNKKAPVVVPVVSENATTLGKKVKAKHAQFRKAEDRSKTCKEKMAKLEEELEAEKKREAQLATELSEARTEYQSAVDEQVHFSKKQEEERAKLACPPPGEGSGVAAKPTVAKPPESIEDSDMGEEVSPGHLEVNIRPEQFLAYVAAMEKCLEIEATKARTSAASMGAKKARVDPSVEAAPEDDNEDAGRHNAAKERVEKFDAKTASLQSMLSATKKGWESLQADGQAPLCG